MKHSNGTCKTRTGQDAETRQGTRFTSTLKDGALSLKKVDTEKCPICAYDERNRNNHESFANTLF